MLRPIEDCLYVFYMVSRRKYPCGEKHVAGERDFLCQKISVLPQNVIPFSWEGGRIKTEFCFAPNGSNGTLFLLKTEFSFTPAPSPQSSLLHPLTTLCTEEEKHNAVMRKSAEY